MSQPFIGEIRMFGGSFAPAGWAFCDGQLMPISQNDALFTLIGTTYGGDGQETFGLPNLQSRHPMHQGNGFILGETGGVESVTLTVQQIPVHSHAMLCDVNNGAQPAPANNVPAATPQQMYVDPAGLPPNGILAPNVSPTGGSQPHDNMSPYLVISFIISLFGIFPTQT